MKFYCVTIEVYRNGELYYAPTPKFNLPDEWDPLPEYERLRVEIEAREAENHPDDLITARVQPGSYLVPEHVYIREGGIIREFEEEQEATN